LTEEGNDVSSLAISTSKEELKKSILSNNHSVYDESKEKLFFNENSIAKDGKNKTVEG